MRSSLNGPYTHCTQAAQAPGTGRAWSTVAHLGQGPCSTALPPWLPAPSFGFVVSDSGKEPKDGILQLVPETKCFNAPGLFQVLKLHSFPVCFSGRGWPGWPVTCGLHPGGHPASHCGLRSGPPTQDRQEGAEFQDIHPFLGWNLVSSQLRFHLQDQPRHVRT